MLLCHIADGNFCVVCIDGNTCFIDTWMTNHQAQASNAGSLDRHCNAMIFALVHMVRSLVIGGSLWHGVGTGACVVDSTTASAADATIHQSMFTNGCTTSIGTWVLTLHSWGLFPVSLCVVQLVAGLFHLLKACNVCISYVILLFGNSCFQILQCFDDYIGRCDSWLCCIFVFKK